MPTVNELILKLKELESDSSIISILTSEQEQEGYYTDELHPLVQEIISLANDVLINELGKVNWSNVNLLKQEGFLVIPGDNDSYGWLTGLIKTSKGDIMFG